MHENYTAEQKLTEKLMSPTIINIFLARVKQTKILWGFMKHYWQMTGLRKFCDPVENALG